jgi:hypothetical protein
MLGGLVPSRASLSVKCARDLARRERGAVAEQETDFSDADHAAAPWVKMLGFSARFG